MTDPWPEFYQEDENEEDSFNEEGLEESFSGTVQCSDSVSMIHQKNRNVHDSHNASFNDSIMDPMLNKSVPIQMKSDFDCQLQVDLEYKGNASITISTELIIHHPTPCFLTLPIRMTVTNLDISGILFLFMIVFNLYKCIGRALIVYLNDSIQICFTKDSLPILKNMNIESEIGDRDRQVLKNLGKIERFVCEQLRMLLMEWFVFPNCYYLDLSE